MFGLGTTELLIVGIVAVLLFGRRLPEVARSLGRSYQQFRRGLDDLQSEMHRAGRMMDSQYRQTQRALSDTDSSSSDDRYAPAATAAASHPQPPAEQPGAASRPEQATG
jgi:sec-independent protein translocase protein TatA